MKNIFDLDSFREIWQAISRNKTRSFLTGFGVLWGIFMYVTMMSAGNGIENGFMEGITDMQNNSLFVANSPTTVEYKGFNTGRLWSMNSDDVRAIKEKIPEVEYISGLVFASGSNHISKNDRSGQFAIRGNDEIYYNIETQPLVYGRYFNRLDLKEKRKICILGMKVYEQLFEPDVDPVGEMVSIDGIPYIVVGVVNPTGKISMGSEGVSTVYIPSTTLQQVYNYGNDIDIIMLTAYPHVDINDIERKVSNLMKERHMIAPEDETAVMTMNLQQIFLAFRYLFLGIDILIWIVGMGTLLAGVVGVSNIMLVSIKERTREIGIKRALGAKPSVIIIQIMSESMLLTFIAGFFGLFFGVILSVLLDSTLGNSSEMFSNPYISFSMAIIASAIILVSGALAGIIPARNALKVKPIDAIREE